ncbi:valine--tRNA ligase [Striga asiatica]|uniref:Valine--tRNA ligase n=1 Tax=Striga asiatica TaxID=4170 RepID=A0A5A7RDW9_STRAF|nr:valine--tRNA ligase [Striga asiatica]
MPSPKSHGRLGGPAKSRKGRPPEKASSFHGRGAATVAAEILPRPRTVPDLLSGTRSAVAAAADPAAGKFPARLTKLLLHVTVQRSPGALHVLMPPEATVEELIAAVLGEYVKDGRRPFLPSGRASGFDLHYSQFSLESLDRDQKLMDLGSRNFFLCPAAEPTVGSYGAAEATTSASNCSIEAGTPTNKKGLNWLKFVDFLF